METLAKMWRRIQLLLRRNQLERELEEEMKAHLELAAQESMADGTPEDEARRQAARRFGNRTSLQEESRESWGFPRLEEFLLDLRYGARWLVRNPGLSAVAVLTLALGIGTTTSLFSVVNAALLRSLPYPAADRLAVVRETTEAGSFGGVAYPNYLDWKSQTHVFESMAAYTVSVTYNFQAGDRTERINGEIITAEYFSLLGARAIRGRLILPAETSAPGESPVAVISHGLWQREFGGDPAVLGRRLLLNEAPFTVVGIMAPSFRGLSGTAEIWTPITMYNQLFPEVAKFDFLHSRDTHWHRVLARLKPGVAFEQAQTEMKQIGDRLAADYPKENKGRSAGLSSLGDVLQGKLRTPLWLLLGAVGIVMLIACANVANLLLTRMVSREREFAVRAALGAGPRRLLRQLLTESLLLVGIGGLAGAALAHWTRSALLSVLPMELPAFAQVRTDAVVAGFALLATLVACALVGFGPARRAAGCRAEDALRAGARSHGGRRTRRMGDALAVCQIALAMVLLCGAGLLARTLWAMRGIELGFQPDHLVLLRFDVPNQGYEGEKRLRLGEELANHVRGLPGVASAAATYIDPFLWSGINRGFTLEGQQTVRGDWENVLYVEAGPGFFATMGVPMRQGREFNGHDTSKAERVVIVSEAFAKRFWPGASPLGKRMKFGSLDFQSPWMTVVGVAGDFQFDSLTGNLHTPVFYAPTLQSEVVISLDLIVRTRSTPEAMIPMLRDAVQRFDRNLPVYSLGTMEQRLSGEMASTRSFALLLGFFSGSALLLAALGVYGVLASAVGQRIQELGMRLALGANRGDILRLVLRQGMVLMMAGGAAGTVAALLLTRWMKSLLYGVTSADPMAFTAGAALLLLVALAACLLPAWRATRVDPVVVLRYE